MKFVIDDSKMLGNRYISKSTILDPDDDAGMRQIPVLTVDATFPLESIGPTSGYCRDCKWWNNPSRDPEGVCDNAFRAGSGIVLFGTDNCLYTKPNFGCVQFEPSDVAAVPVRRG